MDEAVEAPVVIEALDVVSSEAFVLPESSDSTVASPETPIGYLSPMISIAASLMVEVEILKKKQQYQFQMPEKMKAGCW